jgi:hypothetical protein
MTDQADSEPMDVHTWFSLSYSNFLVLHRVELEHMPADWQHQFVRMLQEVEHAYEHLEHPDGYEVYPAEWVMVEDLSEAQAEAAQITAVYSEDGTTYYNSRGDELDPQQRVPIRVHDPIPHYRHGHVEPNLDGLTERPRT